jgi:DNA-binding transcriptional LysR family regulator
MHHIRYFLAVSETLNWTKAAERCNVAQPALTRAIKALESELGGELLRRERSLSHLTELGQRMLPMLRQCYDAALAAKKVAASIRTGGAAPLSIVVSSTVEIGPFLPMLRELSRALPGLQMKLRRGSASEVAECLRTGVAELAIAGPLGETWSRLDVLPLFEESFGLVMSPTHRLAGRDGIEFEDIASETLLINTGGEMVEELTACLEANGLADTARHHVVTREDLLAMLKANLGVAIVPVGTIETNGLRRKSLKKLQLVRKVSAYTVTGRQRAIACAAFFNMLRAADWRFDTANKQ